MDAKSKIESLLPGTWSKWIFCLSPVLSATLYIRFLDLPSSWLPTSDSEKFLIRLLLSESVLLLGSVSLIITLLFHNRKINFALSAANAKVQSLESANSALSSDVALWQSSANKSILVQKRIESEKDQIISNIVKTNYEEVTRLKEQHKVELDKLKKPVNKR